MYHKLYSDSLMTQKCQIQLDKQHYSNRNIPSASQDCLLKYFPKYYQRLKVPFKSINWPVLKRIKQIKTLHHLDIENYDPNKTRKSAKILRGLLQNKRKHLRSIPSITPLLSLELGIFLPCLHTLNLVPKWSYGWWNNTSDPKDYLKRRIWRFYKRFWVAFRHLKHVKMYEYDHDLHLLTQIFNKDNKIIAHLKTFALNFETFDQRSSRDDTKEILKNLLKSRSFLNQVTHLNFREDIFTSFKPFSESFLQSCSKVSHLNVHITKENDDQKYMSILRNLHSLQNLQDLTLNISDPELFINQMEFPKSLQSMSLTMHYSKKSENLWFLFAEKFRNWASWRETMVPLESISRLVSLGFLERWGALTQLKTLELNFHPNFIYTFETNAFNEDFLPLLLKGLFNLEKFVLKFSFNSCKGRSFQLSSILDVLSGLRSLRHLTILDESEKMHRKLSLNLQSDLEKILLLSHLSTFNIDCAVHEPSFFRNFIKKFLSDSQQPKNICLSEIKMTSHQSLIEFFQTLNSRHSPVQHNLSFRVHLCLNRMKDLLQSFETPLILGGKIPVEIAIDFRAQVSIFLHEYEEALGLLRKTFPQFKVVPSNAGDQFLLNNFVF